MIVRCFWQNRETNCAHLFIRVTTDAGTCCQFNGIPGIILQNKKELFEAHKDNIIWKKYLKKWQSWKLEDYLTTTGSKDDGESKRLPPFRPKNAGKDSSLSILVNPELDEYYCPIHDSTGFTLLAGSPIDQPEVSGFGVGIEPNSENFVDVSPELTVSDANINDLPVEKRNCYFHEEFPLRFYTHYTIRNCRHECLTNITVGECGCVKTYMAKDDKTKVCGSINDTCALNIRRRMNKEGLKKKCVQCMPSCTTINYSVNLSKLPMNPHKNPWKKNNAYVDSWAEKNLSIIHVYLGSEVIYSKYRQRVYDMSSLMSNAGGLLGLYFGFSLLSLLEIFYHFIFKPLFEQSEDGEYILAQKLKSLSENKGNQTDDIVTIQKIFVKSNMNGKTHPPWSHGEPFN